LGTFTKRFLSAEINFRGLAGRVFLLLSKIELRLELVRQLDDGGERPAQLAAETLQGTNRPLRDQFFDFRNLELPPGSNFPQREIAFIVRALKLFVSLLHHAAAFRTRHLQLAEIAGRSEEHTSELQ